MASATLANIPKFSGFDAFDRMKAEDDAKNPRNNGSFRFYLKKGSGAHLIMLSDQPDLVTYEHTIKIGNRWENLVCLGEDCPACAAGNRPSLTSFFSVILVTATPKVDEPRYPDLENLDDRAWEADWEVRNDVRRKNGALVLNPIQLLPAKKFTAEILRKQYEKRDGLRGALFEVSRSTNDTSPGVGDVWDFERKFEEDDLPIFQPELKPVDLEETLKALTADEMRALLVGNSEAASGGSNAAAASSAPAQAPKRKLGW